MTCTIYILTPSYIDFAKTITMFLVILCHCLLFFANNPYWAVFADYQNDVAIFLCNILTDTVVPLFVFCSGFLFQVSLQKKDMSTSSALVKRTKRLLLPYLLYGFLWLVPTYTLLDIPSYGREKGASLLSGYQSMLLGQFSDVAWFLLMLFWVSGIWILLRNFLRKDYFLFGALTAVALYMATHELLSGVRYYALNQIDVFLVVFFAGASFFWGADKVAGLSAAVLLPCSLAGMLACSIAAQYGAASYWLYSMIAVAMPFLLVILSMGLCKFKVYAEIEASYIYKWLLQHNMNIYLMQAPAMYLSFMVFYPVIGENFFLCVTAEYIFTILLDFIAVYILAHIISWCKKK